MLLVQIVTGLYYSLGSILLLRKLAGTEEYDVVVPTGGGRPKTEKPADHGFLAFQAGLHGPQRIPDSGWTGTDHGAWTVKVPWEAHLRRRLPPEEYYDPRHPFWEEYAVAEAERRMGRDPDYLRKIGLTDASELIRRCIPREPLPREVEFEIRGEWWDTNFRNRKVDDMTIRFKGEDSFVEVTLADMRSLNEEGSSGQVHLKRDGNLVTEDDAGRPVYFDPVYNPYAGVMNDWELWFKGNLCLVPVRTSEKQLRRWFCYDDPGSVQLVLPDDPVDEQELDYEWW